MVKYFSETIVENVTISFSSFVRCQSSLIANVLAQIINLCISKHEIGGHFTHAGFLALSIFQVYWGRGRSLQSWKEKRYLAVWMLGVPLYRQLHWHCFICRLGNKAPIWFQSGLLKHVLNASVVHVSTSFNGVKSLSMFQSIQPKSDSLILILVVNRPWES